MLPRVNTSPGRVDEQTALYEFTDRALSLLRSERDICDAALDAISAPPVRALFNTKPSIILAVMRF
jgi:hypothetical protein